MMLAAALFLVGALVQGAAPSHIIFVIARICGGMAVGAASVLSPGLHLRSRARQHPRPADHRAADHDHHRPDRCLRGQLFPRQELPAFRRPVSGAGSKRGAGCS